MNKDNFMFKCKLLFKREIEAQNTDEAYNIFADMISNISNYKDYIEVENE
jgi:hypothetical protein